uniref:Uncharacterized protein n=1 Tax=Rhizophora mucronata TaxID=61149 RepID=A0A2P2QKF3_RHIMU
MIHKELKFTEHKILFDISIH